MSHLIDRLHVRNATFLFQQCCGGGFLDDLNDTLPGDLSWIGGASSQWNEVSAGLPSQRELVAGGKGVPTGFPVADPNFWTGSLFAAFDSNPNITVHDAIGAALIGDPVGTFGEGVAAFGINKVVQENNQRIDQNGDVRAVRIADHESRALTGDTPLAAVATLAGFADQSHMGRDFKRVLGMTPGRLRVSCRAFAQSG